MSPTWKRCGIVLAMVAILSYSLHVRHGSIGVVADSSDHCCICHTIGITAVVAPSSYRPPVPISRDIVLLVKIPNRIVLFASDSPRAPPAA